MRRAVVASGVVGILLLASLFLLRQRGPVERSDDARSAEAVPVRAPAVAAGVDVAAERSDVAREAAIDLLDAPQTFRNSTLLFAVRRAGFYCADVVSAHESADGVWVASCSDMLGYIVTLRGAELFDVHPVAQYFDSVAPAIIDERLIPVPSSPEPQPLR